MKQIKNKTKKSAVPDASHVTAQMSRENLKSLFYLLSGKPDSTIKYFEESLIVTVQDIIDLNDEITKKLKTHDILGIVNNISVSFSDNTLKEFNNIEDFINFNWKRSEITESLLLKWDFLVNISGYEIPQRHTITVRLASGLQPQHFLQAIMATGKSDNIENFEIDVAPVYCRIDFINQIIAQEIIQRVSEWHKSRRKAGELSWFYAYIKKVRVGIARFIRYSLPVFTTGLAVSALFFFTNKYCSDSTISIIILRWLFSWLLISIIGILLFSEIGKRMGNTTYEVLEKFGSRKVFIFTNGDNNKQEEYERRDKKLFGSFLFRAIITILYNLIAAIIATIIIH